MARPLRIEYHGAWYHVMNRGANRKLIFYSDIHRNIFISLLEEITRLYSIEIHSYCLMGNHYHLLIRTSFPNLSKAMRHLNGIYTQKFNQIEKRDGALFRGRYKAILIQDDSYLLQASRYIHLNPVTAKLCDSPEDYAWSSYQSYINKSKNFILQTSFILDQIGGIKNYIDFMQENTDEEIENFYNKPIAPSILGSKDFKENALKNVSIQNIEASSADIKRLVDLPEPIKIIEAVATYFDVNIENIVENIRGKKNIYRLIAIYLSKVTGQHSYSKIATYFNTTSNGIRGILRYYQKTFSMDNNVKQIIDILLSQ